MKKYQESFGYLLLKMSRIWNYKLMEVFRSEGYYNLKPSFCSVFFPLFENDGQSASNIARSAGVTKQTMSIYVRELKKRGYIKIVQNAQDKRESHIFLTAKGCLLKKVFDTAIVKIHREMTAKLCKREIQQLSTVLDKMSVRDLG